MPKSGKDRGMGETGLAWVDFPWMQIKDKRAVFAFINPFESRLGEPVWKNSEISTPGNRDVTAKQEGCGNRIFHHVVVG